MKVVGIHEAKTHLSALLVEVVKRGVIVIARGKKPLAKLVPYGDPAARPRVGEVMDAHFVIPDSAFRPLNEDELHTWGLQ